MVGTLSRCPKPRWLLSGMPLDVAANGWLLVLVDRLAIQDCIQCHAQIAAIQSHLVPWAAAVELAAIAQGLKAPIIGAEQIELRRAGTLEGFGQDLPLIQEIGETPLPLLCLMAQAFGAILWMGGEAVAGDGQQRDGWAVVLGDPAQFGFHMFHKRAVCADQHHQ